MGYKKIDKNQNEIVDALRSAGCSCVSLASIGKGVPDLLVCTPNKKTYLLEIKDGKNKLTPHQEKWQKNWNGNNIYNIRTIEEAFIVLKLIKGK